MDVDAKFTCGDVNVASIKEIWQKRNENMVKLHIDHQFDQLPEICKNCTDWTIIGEERFDENGNRVEKSYEHGDNMLSSEE